MDDVVVRVGGPPARQGTGHDRTAVAQFAGNSPLALPSLGEELYRTAFHLP
jgi:hypothetical protein